METPISKEDAKKAKRLLRQLKAEAIYAHEYKKNIAPMLEKLKQRKRRWRALYGLGAWKPQRKEP